MPLYEYECTTCHKHTEKIQKFSDPEITVCPHCGGHLERVVSAPAIAFKGGGWYADGYGNAKPKSSGDNSTASSEAKPGTTGSESKSSADSSASSSSAPAASAAPAAAPAPTSSSADKK
jgi:putative FmdB family regulatory protein